MIVVRTKKRVVHSLMPSAFDCKISLRSERTNFENLSIGDPIYTMHLMSVRDNYNFEYELV